MTDVKQTAERISTERLKEMLAGLKGVSPGPWGLFSHGSTICIDNRGGDGRRPSIVDWPGFDQNDQPLKVNRKNAAHIARCDPETMRSILTELIASRQSDTREGGKASDTKNTVSDEQLAHYIEYADLVGHNGTPAISTGELAAMARELQSLRASIPGGLGVKGLNIGEGWETHSLADKRKLQHDAGIPHLPTDMTFEARKAVSGEGPRAYEWSDKKHRLVFDLCREIERLYALDLSPAEPVDPKRWREHVGNIDGLTYTEQAVAAPANPVISDDLVHAAQFLIERLDDFENGSLGDSIEDACRDFDGHISPAIERLRSALSVNPQIGSDKP